MYFFMDIIRIYYGYTKYFWVIIMLDYIVISISIALILIALSS